MHSYIFHIGIYDLFCLAAMFGALTLALLLAFAGRQSPAAALWLSPALVVLSLHLAQLPVDFFAALGPLFYFFVRKTVLPEQPIHRKDWAHFSVVLISPLAPGWLVSVFILVYLYLSHYVIQQFYDRIELVLMDRPRLAFRRLEKFLYLFAFSVLLGLLNDAFAVASAAVLIVMAALVILKPEVFTAIAQPKMIAADLREKIRRLKQTVKERRLYEDPELTLPSLAAKLAVPVHELSRIINMGLKKNFNDFINELRVQEVSRKMRQAAYDQLTLLAIAYESGFNSKTTFNRVFREVTGKSAAEYKSELEKLRPSYNPGHLHRSEPVLLRSGNKRNFMIKNYIKIALRNLWRHKRMTFINISGLSIGIAATALIVLWIQNEFSFDRFQPDAANIYRIKASVSITKTETWQWETSQYILGEHALREIPEVKDLSRLERHYGDLNMHLGDRTISEQQSAYVDDRWFNMFHYDIISGSLEEFTKNPFSLVLTQSAAKRYFGAGEAVGKILRIDTNNYQVRAVVKDYPPNSSFRLNVLLPVTSRLADPREKKNALAWGNYSYQTYLKLRPGANTFAVAAKLQSIMRSNKKDDKGNTRFSLMPLTGIHFETDIMNSTLIHGNRTIVNAFIILAALLLVTACINYVNLTTARASLRSKEVSVRKIVGAGKGQLFGQFMSESLLVSLVSLLFALALIVAVMPWFRTFTDKPFANPLISPAVWIILGGTLLVAFLLNGLYPALLLSSFQPMNVFRGRSLLSFKDTALRRVLVVTQFVISVILITGTLVIYRQMKFIQQMDPGYDRSEVFSFSFPWWSIPHVDFNKGDQLMQTVKQQLQEQSATSNVAMGGSGLVNFTSSGSGGFDWAGRPKTFNPSFAPLGVDQDFGRLMHLQVKSGRWFTGSEADRHNAILNETALNMIGLHGDPIGQRFVHQGDTGVIIGVVKDFHFKSLHDKIGPMVLSLNNFSGFYVKAAKGNTAAAIAATEKVWKKYFPDAPFDYVFLDDAYNSLYQAEQQQSVLITAFTAIAVFISALGLLGLAAFAAEQKVKEIGIRKVLGATIRDIVALLSADFIILVGIASVIASPVAWWAMNKWLQGFAYRVNLSWWLFAISAGIALLIALITVSVQSAKAALANPVNSLRSE